MASEQRAWRRQDEAFWRAHHEAWKRSDLNQRQYCEAEGIPLKAFGNWRAQVQSRTAAVRSQAALPTPPVKSSPESSRQSSPSSGDLSLITLWAGPIGTRLREGHRRRFSDTDKRRILDEAARPGASTTEVARRYGIARRLLRRWKQELAVVAPTFVTDVGHSLVPPDVDRARGGAAKLRRGYESREW